MAFQRHVWPKPSARLLQDGDHRPVSDQLMTPADVLVAGNWLTEEQAAAMAPGDQRQALVKQLSRITHMPADSLSGLRDYDLIGRGAAIAFLLQMGIVNEGALGIDWSLDNYRNTLIVETAGLDYDGGALQGLTDQCLSCSRWNMPATIGGSDRA
jgi:hypothetical protein